MYLHIVQVMIIMFLGKFTSSVRLSWQLWIVSIVIGVLRSVYLLCLMVRWCRSFHNPKPHPPPPTITTTKTNNDGLVLYKLHSWYWIGETNNNITRFYIFLMSSWPLAAIGKLIPVPETPISEFFTRKLRRRKKSKGNNQQHSLFVKGNAYCWSKNDSCQSNTGYLKLDAQPLQYLICFGNSILLC